MFIISGMRLASRYCVLLMTSVCAGAVLISGCAHGGRPGDAAAAFVDRVALRWCDGQDYYGGSIKLGQTIDGSKGDSVSRQHAEFALAQALYCLKYTVASMAAFDRIVRKGPSHAHSAAALEWLVHLSHRLPPDAGDLKDVAEHLRSGRLPPPVLEPGGPLMDPAAGILAERVLADLNHAERFDVDLEQPALAGIRDDLCLLAAKGRYSGGNLQEALAYLRLIPAPSPLHVRAMFLEGAISVRLYRAKPAIDAFKEAFRASAASTGSDAQAFQDLALISLGRTFYSTGQFDLAAKYYARVSSNSVEWADSLFESVWAYFMAGDQAAALDRIAALRKEDLRSPAKPESVAEAIVLKAVIEADRRVQTPELIPMDVISRTFTDVKAIIFKKGHEPTSADSGFRTIPFDLALRIRNGTAGLPSPAARAARAALMERAIGRRFDYVDELSGELVRYDAAPSAWKDTNVAQMVRADLSAERSRAMDVAADLASRRLRRFTQELSQLIKRIIMPDFFEYPDGR